MAELVRVSVAAGTRRADLALPGAVPVAELLPELVRALGVIDGVNGVALATVTGRRLLPGQALAAQDVPDGSVLVVTCEGLSPPRIHDDVAEAMAEAVTEYVAAWPPWAGRCSALVTAALMVATAAGLGVRAVGAGVPVLARCLVALAALVVLAGPSLPRWALSVAGRSSPNGPVDAERVAADARAAHRLLLAMLVTTGTLLLVVTPLAVGFGPWGAGLVVDLALVLALRVRRHHAGAQVLAGLVAALGCILTTATVATTEDLGWWPAAGLGVGGTVVLAGVVLPPTARRIRAAELLEATVVVAVLPLLVAATGVLAWVHTAVAR